jgi:serine/threonine-protein kinase
VPGGTLKGLLEERGALPPEEARRFLVQLAEGLAYAHSKGITHRDFKPENVLLDEDGEPVIADFGMARAARYQTITREDTTLGTPAYMPPEQVQGLRPDHRADLYSLGVVGYQMLAGRLPFDFDLINTMVAHMNAEPPPLPAELPQDLVEVVMRLLRKAPDDRYASAREVRAALIGPGAG